MSSEDKPAEGAAKTEDEELSELLDSALEDFSKPVEKPSQPAKDKAKEDDSKESTQSQTDNPDAEWSDEFIRQAAEQFEANIASILRESGTPEITPDQVQQSFQRMAEAAAQAISATPTEADGNFAASISQALRGLSEGTENLQTPFSEQDLMNMFGSQEGDQNAFVPFMHGMMQSLLSKEVLYPSLKDILDKYPAWIEANKEKITAEDLQRYENQQKLMKQVCDQLEKEPGCISPEQKKSQFDTVLELMQKLQDYGQPPPELVGDLGPGVPFDAQGNPDLSQCTVM